MGRGDDGYTVRELSPRTWPDFEGLFAKHGGAQAGCWCMFYHRARPIGRETRDGEARRSRNRRDKQELVERGGSHGILVYAGTHAVGWCQYGPRGELPRIDAGRFYRGLSVQEEEKPLWRITCFFVDPQHRRKGVGARALRAVLASIEEKGGGTVEAYPVTSKRAVPTWFGSVGMFEREGFRTVSPLGKSNVLVRRTV